MDNDDTLRPSRAYTFQSVTGRTVTIRSRMGRDSARVAAMKALWGNAAPAISSDNGLGLDLVEERA